jgi:hypothetical protein
MAEFIQREAGAEAVAFPFEGSHNTKYFTHNHWQLGVAYLVSQSQFRMDFLINKLLQEDLSFQLHLTSLIRGIRRGQQKKFAVVMSEYHRVSAMKSEEAANELLAASGVNASLHVDPVVLAWDLLPAGSPECPIHFR